MRVRILLFVFALAADVITKSLALQRLPILNDKNKSFFSFALHYNAGISFSLFKEYPNAGLFVSLIGVVVFALVCTKSNKLRTSCGIPFLWAGAIGNLIDRLAYGHVVDWVYMGLYFNLADVWLCFGGLMLLQALYKCPLSPRE